MRNQSPDEKDLDGAILLAKVAMAINIISIIGAIILLILYRFFGIGGE